MKGDMDLGKLTTMKEAAIEEARDNTPFGVLITELGKRFDDFEKRLERLERIATRHPAPQKE